MSKIAEEYVKRNIPRVDDDGYGIVEFGHTHTWELLSKAYDQSAKDIIARVSAEVEKIQNRLCADITLSGMNEKHYALPHIQRIAQYE